MSGYTGVTIDGVDTLQRWSLILLDDLVIEMPKLKSSRISIPGADGTLDFSYALTGEPTFADRAISFTLFKRAQDTSLNVIKDELAALCHGLRKKLLLPVDGTHYFYGTFELDSLQGYGNGKIPVKVTADPYKYKNAETVSTYSISGSRTVTLANEMRRVQPTITTTAAVTISDGEHSTLITAGANQIIDWLILPAGNTTLTITGTATATFKYQEARI